MDDCGRGCIMIMLKLAWAWSGFLHAAKISLGGSANFKNCFTNSRPIPLFAPVINTTFGFIFGE